MTAHAHRVSVCVPVYNRQDCLRRAVDSALAQTFADLEVVIVDNASADRTFAIAQDYAEREPRVRAYRNETNLGPVPNWRRCLELAEGDYAKLLYSDDWLDPDALERMVAAFEARDDLGFVYTSVQGHVHGGVHVWYQAERAGPMPSLEFLWRVANGGNVPASPSAVLFRRQEALAWLQLAVPRRLGFDFDAYGIGNDALLLWRCCERYPFVHHLREPLIHFADPDTEEPSITMSLSREGKSETIRLGYKAAFGYFLATSSLPGRVKRMLHTGLLLASVPVRPSGFRREIGVFGKLFPAGYRWWLPSLLQPRVLGAVLRRLKLRRGSS